MINEGKMRMLFLFPLHPANHKPETNDTEVSELLSRHREPDAQVMIPSQAEVAEFNAGLATE